MKTACKYCPRSALCLTRPRPRTWGFPYEELPYKQPHQPWSIFWRNWVCYICREDKPFPIPGITKYSPRDRAESFIFRAPFWVRDKRRKR